MQTDANELLAIARRYCTVIESLDDGNRKPLAQLNEILPRLHAAMTAVPWQEEVPTIPNVDLDQRFELFSRLHRLLGDLDGYWMEYDVTPRPPGDERQPCRRSDRYLLRAEERSAASRWQRRCTGARLGGGEPGSASTGVSTWWMRSGTFTHFLRGIACAEYSNGGC